MEGMRGLPLRLHCVLLAQANVQCTLSSFEVGEGEGGEKEKKKKKIKLTKTYQPKGGFDTKDAVGSGSSLYTFTLSTCSSVPQLHHPATKCPLGHVLKKVPLTKRRGNRKPVVLWCRPLLDGWKLVVGWEFIPHRRGQRRRSGGRGVSVRGIKSTMGSGGRGVGVYYQHRLSNMIYVN